MKISVALAAKDGARYLPAQVASILPQLSEERGDELIISTDPSKDATTDIARELATQFSLVKYIQGPGRGVQANFEHAIKACTGSHIFLSDQDDIWMPNKIAEVLKEFEASNATLIVHDAVVVDEDLNQINPSFFALSRSKPGVFKNIMKNSFIGCCMAFETKLTSYALPFPQNLPMHDQWLGLLASRYLTVSFLPQQLIQYRRHANTSTTGTHAGVKQMVTWRCNILRALRKRNKELK
ncbi:MAG: glycosyltransferase [Coriobacteriia bacterium]|nr:glycosyltransferase [Coriobacteriia bacterium]MCL2749552.1 glycosyltransferase [Coriobacteriia bacterium]